jgi:transcriptional regulator GlxA family with amidase domain
MLCGPRPWIPRTGFRCSASEGLVAETKSSAVRTTITAARTKLVALGIVSTALSPLGTSERSLARRLNTVMGKSPLAYFQDLRVERAVHLLQTTNQTIDEIATMVGYSNAVTLRTLLRRKLGKGIRELRGRYCQRLYTKNRRILR